MIFVLLGPPGAGKGTQAQMIAQHDDMHHLATGDLLRQAVRDETALGIQVKRTLAEGALVSDDIINRLMVEHIRKIQQAKQHVLLDGYPRTLGQAEALRDEGIVVDLVLEIQVPDDALIQRLSGRRVHPASGRVYHTVHNPPKVVDRDDVTGEPLIQRNDDREETIKQRLHAYHEQTEPLIDFYKNDFALRDLAERYISVDGMQDIDDIARMIKHILAAHF